MTKTNVILNKAVPNKITFRAAQTSLKTEPPQELLAQLDCIKKTTPERKEEILCIINTIQHELVSEGMLTSKRIDALKNHVKWLFIFPRSASNSFVDSIIYYAQHKHGGYFNWFHTTNFTTSVKNILQYLEFSDKQINNQDANNILAQELKHDTGEYVTLLATPNGAEILKHKYICAKHVLDVPIEILRKLVTANGVTAFKRGVFPQIHHEKDISKFMAMPVLIFDYMLKNAATYRPWGDFSQAGNKSAKS